MASSESDRSKNGLPSMIPFSKGQSGNVGVTGAIRPISTTTGVYVYRPSFATTPSTASRGVPRINFRPQAQRHPFPTTSRLPTSQFGGSCPRFISASALLASRPGTRYRRSSSATRWIRPNSSVATATGSNMSNKIEIPSSNANPGRPNQNNSLGIGTTIIVPTTTTTSSSVSGPMKPIVCLNNGIHHGKNNKKFNPKYKFPTKSKAMLSPVKFTQNGVQVLKVSPRRNFSVRKYSLKRIRKSSLSSPKSKRLGSIQSVKGQSSKYSFINTSMKRKHSADHSISFSQPLQSQSFCRRATRVVQRSKKLLNQSKRKKNTFCLFFNKFGSCRRRNEGCPFIHDPRQVWICSRYLGTGSCTQTGCTLSHNESIGKIPSCKFFNEGLCTKEKCPFRHVESGSPSKKRNSLITSDFLPTTHKTANPMQSNLQRKRTDINNPKSSSDETSARYFEMLPNSQPIVSIIPRRPRKEVIDNDSTSSSTSDSEDDDIDQDDMNSSLITVSDSASGKSDSGNESELNSTMTGSLENGDPPQEGEIVAKEEVEKSVVNGVIHADLTSVNGDHRRQRLLEKVTKFKLKKSTSTSQGDNTIAVKDNINPSTKSKMPTFFKFS